MRRMRQAVVGLGMLFSGVVGMKAMLITAGMLTFGQSYDVWQTFGYTGMDILAGFFILLALTGLGIALAAALNPEEEDMDDGSRPDK